MCEELTSVPMPCESICEMRSDSVSGVGGEVTPSAMVKRFGAIASPTLVESAGSESGKTEEEEGLIESTNTSKYKQ